ncbi:MAG: hypothetical protein WCG27_02180 [Pseudomonadota bacterium]
MELLKVIREQTNNFFSGKINILYRHNKRFWGHFSLCGGYVVQVQYQKCNNERALFNLLFDYPLIADQLEYVMEAEVIHEKDQKMALGFEQLAEKVYLFAQEISQLHRFRPPSQLYLCANRPDPSLAGIINEEQRLILREIGKYTQVGNLYTSSSLSAGELTRALVGLRKIGAIKVVNN